MASVLRPRRGKRSVAIANSIVLRKGEIFFEVPENGVGTGAGKIKMGDGVTGYEQLPYFSDVDISNSPVRFTEAEDADVSVLLNTISSGNPLNTITGASKRLLRKYDQMIATKARSVNGYTPDANGNINLQKVPLADNIYSPDNVENFDTYIYRSTAGSVDISSGEAQLSFIKGNSVVSGRVAEQIDANYTSQHVPEPEEVYTTPTVAVDHTAWRSSTLGSASGTYIFTYDGSVWKYNSSSVTLSDYGITVTGDVYSTDSFNVVYVKANQGTITVAKPTAFKASGLNWFDKNTMTISGYTLDASGNIVASSGSTVGYIRNTLPPDHSGFVIYNASSTLTRVGWKKTAPAAGTTGVTVTGLGIVNNPQLSYVVPDEEGYVIFAYTGSPDVCAHASWSGGEDTSYDDYALSTITIPTKDVNNANLPTATYGMPSVGGVADTLSFDLKMYTQYIGQMAYSAANLATVQAMGVDYDYDSTNIFYVLPTPNTFYLATEVSGVYECHDYGSEWFECSTTTPIVAAHLYGQNLRDKLRHNVVTISPMTGDNALTDAQKTTFRSNIGAASAADVTQLNNDLYTSPENLNCIYQNKFLGTITLANVDTFFNDNFGVGSSWKARVGNRFIIQDGQYDSEYIIAGINTYLNKGGNYTPGNHYVVIPTSYINHVNPDKRGGVSSDIYILMNSTNTTGVSKNTLNPLYATTQGVETAGYQGYYGSDMNQIYIPEINARLQSVLGTHMIKIHNLLGKSVDLTKPSAGNPNWNGLTTDWGWFDNYAFLLSEVEVYGSIVWSSSGFDIGIGCEKLPIFNFINHVQFSRDSFWLRAVASSTDFCIAHNLGSAICYRAANPGICARPAFLIR